MNTVDNTVNNTDDRQTVIAEFTALRGEILQRSSILWNVFALQLAAAGAVFSFALSSRSHIEFLLILPVIAYALSARYASQMLGIERIGKYINEVLDDKANKLLNWEKWQASKSPNERNLTWTWLHPLFLVFPGVAVAALIWVAPYVWAGHDTWTGHRVLLTVIWFVDIAVTLVSMYLVARIVVNSWRWSLATKTNYGSEFTVHDCD
jgi:hypothetical protein